MRRDVCTLDPHLIGMQMIYLCFTVHQSRSMKTLPETRPRPSMVLRAPASRNLPLIAAQPNRLAWSALSISGGPMPQQGLGMWDGLQRPHHWDSAASWWHGCGVTCGDCAALVASGLREDRRWNGTPRRRWP